MHRRSFLIRTGSLALSAAVGPGTAVAADPRERLGMGTVIFRNRFEQTKPKGAARVENPLSLLTVPAYYRDRFAVRQLEFWSHHFESLDRPYLEELRDRVQAAGAELINVQVDAAYDLASADEEERQERHQVTAVENRLVLAVQDGWQEQAREQQQAQERVAAPGRDAQPDQRQQDQATQVAAMPPVRPGIGAIDDIAGVRPARTGTLPHACQPAPQRIEHAPGVGSHGGAPQAGC